MTTRCSSHSKTTTTTTMMMTTTTPSVRSNRCCFLSVALLLTVQLLLFCSTGEAVKCSICDTAGEHGESCLNHPPPARECEGMDHCINVAKYTVAGELVSLVRSCSPFVSPPACVPGVERHTDETVHLCYLTCSHNGCNGSRSVHHLLNLLRRRRK